MSRTWAPGVIMSDPGLLFMPDGRSVSKTFRMSITDGALVQVAFYGGYFAMVFPLAMFKFYDTTS